MIGEKLNGFTIKSLISEEGGMAKVYLAENGIGKKAAVKVLLPKFFWDEPVKQRFINEAKTMVKLENEHICSVYDLVLNDRYAAIILEYMEGNDLSILLDKHQSFSEEEVWDYLKQVCSALDLAHKNGVVHRDIKPSNLFLHNGKIKLMDFGIAQVKSEAGGRMTKTGTRMGSVNYMSPEQIRSTKDVDFRTDIYSLGITVYQMLTGKLPYTLGNDDTEFAIMEKIIRETPKPIDGVSQQINSFIQKATAKNPEDRYSSMAEALQEFDSKIEQQNSKQYKNNNLAERKAQKNTKSSFDKDQTIIEKDSTTNKQIDDYFNFILDLNKMWVYCENGHRSLYRDRNVVRCKECSWKYEVNETVLTNEHNFPGNYVHWYDNKNGIFTNIETKLKYEVVKIGKQVWFAENYYTNQNIRLSGQKYNFSEAIRACPVGTKLPSDNDWIELEKFLGMPNRELYNKIKIFSSRGKSIVKDFLSILQIFLSLSDQDVIGHSAGYWTSTQVGNNKVWQRYITKYEINRDMRSLSRTAYVRYILL